MIAKSAIDAVDGFFHRGGKVVADKVTTIRRVPHEARQDNWSRLEIAQSKGVNERLERTRSGSRNEPPLASDRCGAGPVPADQGLTA